MDHDILTYLPLAKRLAKQFSSRVRIHGTNEDDFFSDAQLALLRAYPHYKSSKGPLDKYLTVVIYRAMQDRARTVRRQCRDKLAPERCSFPSERLDDLDYVERWCRDIPANERRAIVLHYVYGYDMRRAAVIAGVPERVGYDVRRKFLERVRLGMEAVGHPASSVSSVRFPGVAELCARRRFPGGRPEHHAELRCPA